MSLGSIPLVTAQQMTEIDQRAQRAYHIPGLVLMENAGYRAWSILKERIAMESDAGRHGSSVSPAHPSALHHDLTHVAHHGRSSSSARRVLFVAGKGNNGGDALVMARHCAVEGVHAPTVLVTELTDRDPTAGHRQACDALGVTVINWLTERERAEAEIEAADWIVDGIAGTGINGALSGAAAELVAALNAAAGSVMAVDCPSGVGDEFEQSFPAVRARLTVTIGLPKRHLYYRHARALAGEIVVLPIGFPPALIDAAPREWLLAGEEALPRLLPAMPRSAFKNRRGVVAVAAGAHGTSGAAVLCARAAARCGVGMVRLYCDRSVYPVIAPRLESVMVVPVDAESPIAPDGADAMAIGPGWGTGGERKQQLETLLAQPLSGVIDADGVVLLRQLLDAGRVSTLGGRWVLTPHPGEFARLCGLERGALPENPVPLLLTWCKRLNAVIILKGHVNYVARPDGSVTVVDGMNPALGTGGSGDVLAGVVAALLARGLSPGTAAEAGVVLHQAAGRRLLAERGLFLAEDMPERLSSLTAEFTRFGD